jgi:site-specific recombinase XerD
MPMEEITPTITSAIEDYLQFITLTRSKNTALTYGKSLKEFKKLLVKVKIDPENASTTVLTENILPQFIIHLSATSPTKVKPITPTTGRNIVAERVAQALGNEAEGHITPHSFRHYFVSTILRASGNLKLAQALARHENIQITQRYAHINDDELDKGYYDIFEKKP